MGERPLLVHLLIAPQLLVAPPLVLGSKKPLLIDFHLLVLRGFLVGHFLVMAPLLVGLLLMVV